MDQWSFLLRMKFNRIGFIPKAPKSAGGCTTKIFNAQWIKSQTGSDSRVGFCSHYQSTSKDSFAFETAKIYRDKSMQTGGHGKYGLVASVSYRSSNANCKCAITNSIGLLILDSWSHLASKYPNSFKSSFISTPAASGIFLPTGTLPEQISFSDLNLLALWRRDKSIKLSTLTLLPLSLYWKRKHHVSNIPELVHPTMKMIL